MKNPLCAGREGFLCIDKFRWFVVNVVIFTKFLRGFVIKKMVMT
jgi:hypothetical protein